MKIFFLFFSLFRAVLITEPMCNKTCSSRECWGNFKIIGELYHTRRLTCSSVGGWKTICDGEPSVCMCVCVRESVCVCPFASLYVCAYLAASVLMHVFAWASVSGQALRLLVIMRSTVAVRGILLIAGVPKPSSPRSITNSRVTRPKVASRPI